ncbi:enoyl-CoA hydratase/isomerase family protein [Rhizorhabdus sp. FW153]|uniref:enoyl-CoA hydratase/isomerase family protein n=1 Tax=Rhizorhabdus sp. FW153 TaxID=3400216 RepID=UPI003CE7A8CF
MKPRTQLRVETFGAVTVATFHRDEGLNTLNDALLDALIAFATGLDGHCRAAVLAAEGPAFLAGTDLAESIAMSPEALFAYSERAQSAARAIVAAPVPIIAAVNGAAIGGGLEVALACDFILADRSARFGMPEVKLGTMPGLGATYFLQRTVGPRLARELLYTGRIIDAETAQRVGLVNRLCDDDRLRADALETAHGIAAQGPLAVQAIKATQRHIEAAGLDAALECERTRRRALLGTEDRKEGLSAFLERRPPRFEGR